MNEAFGWIWISVGFATGAVLGLFFHREDWLGGYGSYRRRLVRLGHISFLGLGILNILFADSLQRAELAEWRRLAASWGMLVGGLTMPLVCGLTAWRAGFGRLFFIPVSGLLVGAITLATGLL